MVGASFGDRAGLLVVASVGWRLGIERRLELGRLHRLVPWLVGALDANSFRTDANGFETLVGFGLSRSEIR